MNSGMIGAPLPAIAGSLARGCTRISHHDMDHSEASGSARLIGKADCATGGAVRLFHWRKLTLASRRHGAQCQ